MAIVLNQQQKMFRYFTVFHRCFFGLQKKMRLREAKYSLASNGFTRPALFQSNWAAGTSWNFWKFIIFLFNFIRLWYLMIFALLTSEAVKLWPVLPDIAVPCCKSVPAFTGSKGANPRLAAKRGIFGFHLGPKSCNMFFLRFNSQYLYTAPHFEARTKYVFFSPLVPLSDEGQNFEQ